LQPELLVRALALVIKDQTCDTALSYGIVEALYVALAEITFREWYKDPYNSGGYAETYLHGEQKHTLLDIAILYLYFRRSKCD